VASILLLTREYGGWISPRKERVRCWVFRTLPRTVRARQGKDKSLSRPEAFAQWVARWSAGDRPVAGRGKGELIDRRLLVCVSFRPPEPRLACSTSVSERAVCSDAGIFSVPRSLRSSDLPRVPGSRGRAGPWSSTIREDGNTQCCSPAERRGEEKAMARYGSGGRKNGWSPGQERGRSTNDSCY
jgi:hypothetical protein